MLISWMYIQCAHVNVRNYINSPTDMRKTNNSFQREVFSSKMFITAKSTKLAIFNSDLVNQSLIQSIRVKFSFKMTYEICLQLMQN